jgi:2-polyprenyl-6-methoxyphenol hydroxylase-like FAD-dependent oxidoreductase
MHVLEDGVAVVGGGLAGLTLAAALRGLKRPVEVIDARSDSPVGRHDRGRCLWRGGLAALARAGVGPALVSHGVPIQRVQIWSGRGRLLIDLSARDAPVSGLCIREDALIHILEAACADVSFHNDQQLATYAEDGRGVVLSCHGGWTMRAPVVAGADGARSTVRDVCLDDGPPEYSGDTVWEGITEGLSRLDPGIMHIYWSPRGVRGGIMAVDRAGNWLWWVDRAARAGEERKGVPAREELEQLLAGMDAPLLELIEATPPEGIQRTDVYARRDPGAGGRGRVTLIGDAWHPVPIPLRVGGTLAIEDSITLAECLVSELDPVVALRAYERRRRERVAAATRMLWHLRANEARWSSPAAWLRDFTARHTPRTVVHGMVGRLVTGEPERPRERPAARRRFRWA